ncbi:acyltransferase [Maribacter aquivivus]|uniref:acyltransferase n=1 Tax=Maribacter aquivivus TaxID=228958 RepID=UPI0024955886|nr:acyltransferase [Maribacter aquivivus]
MKRILSLIVIFLPWSLKRFLLEKIWKYNIHPTAKIGLAYIFPKELILKEGCRIEHFNVAINLQTLILEKNSSINRSNWITGYPINTTSNHFKHQKNRESKLILGEEASITKKHHIDCTNSISIGKFTIIAGYSSQLLTHSVNIIKNIQDSAPIEIGDYCFVGTNSVILGGTKLPSYSVLGAKSLLNKSFEEQYFLYGGNPAKQIKPLSNEAKFFNRESRYIV